MAKKKSAYSFPQTITSKAIENFIRVTPLNKKSLLTFGRVLWIIKPVMQSKFEVGGYVVIRPRLQEKKRLNITNDPVQKETYSVFCFSGEQVSEWKEKMNDIDKKVNEGNIYIRLTDKLVRHEYEN